MLGAFKVRLLNGFFYLKDVFIKAEEIEFAPEIPYKKVTPFFKIPNTLVDSGILCMLSSQDLLLYILLLRRSFNGRGYIYTDQILQYTNIHKTHMARHWKRLVNLGLITIVKQSYSKGYKTYIINEIKAIQDTNIK